jgi:hypothetical protein
MHSEKNQTPLMEKFKAHNIHTHFWPVPVFLAGIAVLAFLPFITRLGFYQDDWNIIYIYSLKGTGGIWEYYFSDGRPLTALLLSPLFVINGVNPLRWQITALLLRWLSATLFWLYINEIWEYRKEQTLWAAALFLVYPYFTLQPMSAIYTPHWLGYTAFFLSLYLLILSIKKSPVKIGYMFLSMLVSALGLVTIEYFAGVELIKLLVVWWVIGKRNQIEPIKTKLILTLKLYFPSILVILTFIYYRLVYITQITPRNISPKIVADLSQDFFGTVFSNINSALQDTISVLVAHWPDTLLPEYFDLQVSTNRNILIIVLVSAIVIYLFLSKKFLRNTENNTITNKPWIKQALLFSLLTIVLGQIPAWGIGWHITLKNPLWNSRLGLPSVFGLALLVVVMVDYIIDNKKIQVCMITLLLSLSIGWQLHNTNLFKNSWQSQSEFFQQFLTRAPSITPGTTISSKGEFLSLVGGYPLSFAINTMYSSIPGDAQIPYWFIDVEDLDTKVDRYVSGMPIDREYYTSVFHGNSQQSISLYWGDPEKTCVWLLRPEYQYLPFLPADIQKLDSTSNINLVNPQQNNHSTAFAQIFGEDRLQNDTWCTFFQKAELARQASDWEQIPYLWCQAEKSGFTAQNGVELLPFIEGFARSGDWEQAARITKRANQLNLGMDSVLCPLWKNLLLDAPETIANADYITGISDLLKCDIQN